MPVDEVLTLLRAFNRDRDWEQFHTPKNLAMALTIEAAEVAEHFQWLTNEQSAALPESALAEVREEIGDVLISLLNLADKLGVDPVQAAKDKIEKNRAKYPAGLVRGRADKYHRY